MSDVKQWGIQEARRQALAAAVAMVRDTDLQTLFGWDNMMEQDTEILQQAWDDTVRKLERL